MFISIHFTKKLVKIWFHYDTNNWIWFYIYNINKKQDNRTTMESIKHKYKYLFQYLLLKMFSYDILSIWHQNLNVLNIIQIII